MPARLQLTLAAALAVVAAVLGAILLFGSSSASERPGFTVGPEGFAGAVSPPGARAPDFRLRDENGNLISQRGERGKVTVVTFLYTTCEDTCPITASQILGALDQLGAKGRDVAATAISVDPAQDTPALARRFLVARRITGRMHFALGSRAQLAPLWKAYGVQPQGTGSQTSQKFEHSARVVVVDRRGFQRSAFPLDQLTSDALAHDVRRVLDE